MLELKAAPPPNPTRPATNAAPAAAAAEGAAAEGAQGQDAPFAAVFKEHLAQVADKKAAARVADALLAAQDATAAIVPAIALAETPTDPISLLAPMLSGIALPQAPAAEVDPGPGAGAPSTENAYPTLGIATAAPAVPATTEQPLRTATTQTGSVLEGSPRDAEKPLPVAANIAAATATAGKAPKDGATDAAVAEFETSLTAAREPQVPASPHMPVRSPQAAAPAPASAVVATPLGAPGWDGEVGSKITWMIARTETHAELVLNPPQLGRVEVSLTMNGDQATATFTSANASVREALENAMPRLREILQGAGVSLGQTQVGAESFQQAGGRQENGDNPARGHGREADVPMTGGIKGDENAPSDWLRRGNGLVDTFA